MMDTSANGRRGLMGAHMADKLLGGRYAVQDRIGIGGMATVYRGHRTRSSTARSPSRLCCRSMLATQPSPHALSRRPRQQPALQRPYIVGVYDWGKDGDTYYIVMEYLRGTDLKTGIQQPRRPRPPSKVAQIGSQICSGPL